MSGFRRRPQFRTMATTVGPGVVLLGEPLVDNRGELHIAAEAVIVSRPGVTHLATGPGATMRVGRRAHIGQGTALAALGYVEIGDAAVLGSFVMVMDSDFHVAGEDRMPEPQPVSIGPGARIGHRAVILPGARIGARATVEPGSVVTGNVPDDGHVAGNPATPVGARDNGSRSVARTVAEVFGLETLPSSTIGPDDVAAWDSFGTLRVLIALEDSYDVVLDDRLVAAAQSVGDLERLVTVAVDRRAATSARRTTMGG